MLSMKCLKCESKHVTLTGYCKVLSTEPMDVKEQYVCHDCGFKGLKS